MERRLRADSRTVAFDIVSHTACVSGADPGAGDCPWHWKGGVVLSNGAMYCGGGGSVCHGWRRHGGAAVAPCLPPESLGNPSHWDGHSWLYQGGLPGN